jgi:hypothetical protein
MIREVVDRWQHQNRWHVRGNEEQLKNGVKEVEESWKEGTKGEKRGKILSKS